MASCKVVLEKSFERALAQMSERAQGQVAVVILALEQDCEFKPSEAYIVQTWDYIVACEHVEGWGSSVFWHCEDGKLFVGAAPSVRIQRKQTGP
jgi:hypothetical protein